jgi:uncharacterized protein YceK
MIKSLIASVAVIVLVSGCSTVGTYTTSMKSSEYQIAGHPYRTVKDCQRLSPIGKFDTKCDVPYVGIGGGKTFETITVQSGGTGSFH